MVEQAVIPAEESENQGHHQSHNSELPEIGKIK